MRLGSYPCPLPGGAAASEYAVCFDGNRDVRVLIVPALFGEAGKLRRFTLEVMRRLDGAGIDSFLPDLPGTNESLLDPETIELEDWAMAADAAARHFAVTHVLAIRGGCLLAPPRLPGWHYAPVSGGAIVRTMLRARVLAAREAGREETAQDLLARGESGGIELGGFLLGAEMLRQLNARSAIAAPGIMPVAQEMLGGGGLWLRAEAGDDPAQADALAAIVAVGASA